MKRPTEGLKHAAGMAVWQKVLIAAASVIVGTVVTVAGTVSFLWMIGLSKVGGSQAPTKVNVIPGSSIYFDDEFNTEKPIELKVQGEYLVGVLPHLSSYALVGSHTSSNPQTYDSIYNWIGLITLATIGIVTTSIMIVKSKKRENN